MNDEPDSELKPEPELARASALPRVKLLGRDGNAFFILGACNKAATKAGWTPYQWLAFRAEATSRDYNHLLATVIRNFDIE